MKLRYILLVLMGLVLAIGCGGGSGGSGGGSGQLAVFATDGPNDDYSHIWVKIYKIELLSNSGATVVFDDSAGKIVDLKTLRDQSGGRFLFLGSKSIPIRSYTSARVTLAKDLSVVPNGSSNTEARQFDDSLPGSAGQSQISFALNNGATLGASDHDLVVDFDLALWTESNGKISPSLRHGDHNGLDDSGRHESEDYHGLVVGLSGSAPNQTFTLSDANSSFTVNTNASTVIFNDNGTPNAALANGQAVEVTGTFDVTTRTLVATQVKIEDGQHQGEANLKGSVTSSDVGTGTIEVHITRARRFVPNGVDLTVATSGNTLFFNGNGVAIGSAAFFNAISGGGFLEAEGSYDSNTNVFTATTLKLEDD